MTGRTIGFAVLASALLLPGCETIIDADFDEKIVVACKHAAPPARPSVQNAGGTEEVVVAITSVDVGDRALADGTPAFRSIGFDLDGVCSNQGARPSCASHAWANPDPTDGVDGIDNAGGALMHAEIEEFGIAPFASGVVNEGIRDGNVAPIALLRIRGYNLRVVDDAVELDWYVAEPKGAGPAAPRLDGTDVWPIWDGSVEPGASPPGEGGGAYPPSRFRDPAAYVSDYRLVARLPPGTPLKLQNVLFVSEGLTLSLELAYNPLRVVSGVVAGHVRGTELFRKMPHMTQVFTLGRICRSDPSYPRIKKYFCRFMDAHADGRSDPAAPCDAISLGMRFETTNVRAGSPAPDTPFEACSPAEDPASDDCRIP